MLLEVDNVVKRFQNKANFTTVLSNISFSLNIGEIVGIVGLNGIGKTTLIKSILNLISINSGSIKINNIDQYDWNSRKSVFYLPEKFSPSPYLTGMEFLRISSSFFTDTFNQDLAFHLADKIELNRTSLNRRISTYSKGMSQKIGLIACFMSNAPLLILDEPMSGLDPASRVAVKHMIRDYCSNSDRSVLFSSHILVDVEELCTRIAILHNTNIIFDGNILDFMKFNNAKSLEMAFLDFVSKSIS